MGKEPKRGVPSMGRAGNAPVHAHDQYRGERLLGLVDEWTFLRTALLEAPEQPTDLDTVYERDELLFQFKTCSRDLLRICEYRRLDPAPLAAVASYSIDGTTGEVSSEAGSDDAIPLVRQIRLNAREWDTCYPDIEFFEDRRVVVIDGKSYGMAPEPMAFFREIVEARGELVEGNKKVDGGKSKRNAARLRSQWHKEVDDLVEVVEAGPKRGYRLRVAD